MCLLVCLFATTPTENQFPVVSTFFFTLKILAPFWVHEHYWGDLFCPRLSYSESCAFGNCFETLLSHHLFVTWSFTSLSHNTNSLSIFLIHERLPQDGKETWTGPWHADSVLDLPVRQKRWQWSPCCCAGRFAKDFWTSPKTPENSMPHESEWSWLAISGQVYFNFLQLQD